MSSGQKTTRQIVLVHGGGALCEQERYQSLCHQALEAGLRRDWPKKIQERFAETEMVMPWYGDLLEPVFDPIDPELDWLDRKSTLAELKARADTKAFRRTNYERLPGKSALTEFLADVAAPSLRAIGLGQRAVEAALPELRAYWHDVGGFRTLVSQRINQSIRDALDKADSVALIAHGTGAVLAYDVIWSLSKEMPDKKLSLFLTLGTPLANNTVRSKLMGSKNPLETRYPGNLFQWHNVAAEDDFLCHDKTVADDFAPFLESRKISKISDHLIYNLAVRYGRSAPGYSAGYLIHPRVAEQLAHWLTSDIDS